MVNSSLQAIRNISIVTQEFLVTDWSIPHSWTEDLTRVWNECLFIFEWVQAWNRRQEPCQDEFRLYNRVTEEWVNYRWDVKPWITIDVRKVGDDWVQSCAIAREFRIDKKKSWNKENKETRFVCDMLRPEWGDGNGVKEPPLTKYDGFGLCKLFAKKQCDWLKNSDIPSIYVVDFINLIFVPAWKAYQKGVRCKPKYRNRERQKVDSIKSASFRGQCDLLEGDYLRMPCAPKIHVPKVRSRLFDKLRSLTQRMRENPGNYPKLQDKITEIENSEVRRSAKLIGKKAKELTEEEREQIVAGLDRKEILERAIEYFEKPGSFTIQTREGKTYLTLTAFVESAATHTEKSVGVDVGLDYLCHTSSGLLVKHQQFFKEYARIDTLKSHQSKMQHGSRNYQKIQAKIQAIHGRIKRSRSKRQDFYAQQIADVNGIVAVKRIEIKDAIATPAPVFSAENDIYLPNGKTEAKQANREIHDCALAQFTGKIEQQCRKRQRSFSLVSIEEEATPAEIISEVDIPAQLQGDSPTQEPNYPSVIAASKSAQSSSGNAREGSVKAPITAGKVRPTGSQTLIESIAHPPKPSTVPRKRNKKKERKIG